jgi:pimeloyl-ACP methyl ester carboxylesterase
MRAIGQEQAEVMARLGFERFAVVGHDRGARCAYRMAIDHPEVVERLAVLDIVPTGEAFRRADKDFALGYWVWSLLAAPAPIPERLIAAEPELLVNHMLDSWSEDPTAFPDQLRAAYVEPFTDPATVAAICEEYRAAATLDVAPGPGTARHQVPRSGAVERARRHGCVVRPAGHLVRVGGGRDRDRAGLRALPAGGSAGGDHPAPPGFPRLNSGTSTVRVAHRRGDAHRRAAGVLSERSP